MQKNNFEFYAHAFNILRQRLRVENERNSFKLKKNLKKISIFSFQEDQAGDTNILPSRLNQYFPQCILMLFFFLCLEQKQVLLKFSSCLSCVHVLLSLGLNFFRTQFTNVRNVFPPFSKIFFSLTINVTNRCLLGIVNVDKNNFLFYF
jgi:hypothetical protein